MPFGLCNASATFQRAIARALRKIVNRKGSMVMAYIDDIVIATETVEDHMARLREVFECLREAGFKMRVAKCDFIKSEIKYLGRVVSAEGVKPDPKAVAKLRDWEIPRNKTEMQSFLGFANYYREFIPWHAKLVAPLPAVTWINVTFTWGPEQQKAFNEIKKALIEATALAQPDSEGEFVLDTDASAVAISGILHQWQGPPGERRLRPIVYGSKKLIITQAKYGAPKLEMFAAYFFIVKNHSYLCPRKFTLRVDNRALSWLKTYSTDQALIGRWIMTLDKYHFRVEHRPRTQHRNADGLSKRTKEYRWREKQLAQLPAAGERWNFLSTDEFDKLPIAPWFDFQGRVIPNHPDLPAHLENLEPRAPDQVLRVLRRTQRANRRDRQAKALAAPLPPQLPPVTQTHEDFYPDYPEDWIDITAEASEDYLLPTHAVNVPSRTMYSVAGASAATLQSTPSGVCDSIMALRDIDTELHEHAHTVHGIKDLVLAQNRDFHVLALKKLVQCESIDHDIFLENVREFARSYFRQKKDLLFVNKNGVLCVQFSPTQRPLHERPCMVVMPQLYQHEILFRAHDAMGHQGISKVVARIQERHTWPGIRRSVGRYVGQCLTCQQVRDKPGDVRFLLKNIQSGYFNELVQYDYLKICPSDNNNTGILVIIDLFSKFAEADPCSHHDNDAVTTSRLLLQKWFARHGTPTRMQSDNAPSLTADVSNEFLKAAHVTKVTSSAGHPRTQGLVERQNRTLLTPRCCPERGPLLLSKGGGEDHPSRKRNGWSEQRQEQGRKKRQRKSKQGTQPKQQSRSRPKPKGALREASEAPRYQLRSKRQPRYKSGTCGLRDCVCLLAVNENRRVPTGARRVLPEREENLVHRLTVRAKKTYSAVERSGGHPVDSILEKLSSPGVAKDPCPRFKEWTSNGKGLEFTVMPPVPRSIAFGPFNFEREPVQMARCITADLLCDKYGVHVEPGGVYSSAPHWSLLVTAPRVEAIVEPLHLLSCLEGLRTLTTADLILCFHIIDWYRGKVKSAWWLELIITCFTTYPRVRLLDEWTHTFEIPLSPKAWSRPEVIIERCHARCGKT